MAKQVLEKIQVELANILALGRKRVNLIEAISSPHQPPVLAS